VNGSDIYQCVLREGDVIGIGKYRLIFCADLHAKFPKARIRVVRGSSTGSFTEASTSALHLSTTGNQGFTSEQRELLEQLDRKRRTQASFAERAADLVPAILHATHADRGFIGIFAQARLETIDELGVTNMGENDEIEITDDSFMQHLLDGEVVQESSTLLVPFSQKGGINAFLCTNRRDKRKAFTANDAEFLLAVTRLLPPYAERGADLPDSDTPEVGPLEWPIEMVGRSKQLSEVIHKIDMAAASRMNVLVLGESGSGKELVARRLHQRSSQAQGPFLARNCSQTTESLAEAEMFGYVPKSGIAGADPKGAPGWFELANGGTLFLDEVHRLSPAMQDKLLRVLQDKQIWRIGAKTTVKVDVNVVAATDEDLDRAVEESRFRKPLFYRFGARIQVPPLRFRRGDIPLLAYFFLDKNAKSFGSGTKTISRRGLHLLWTYDWPGNVRQLEHAIQAAVARDHEVIFSWDLEDLLPRESPAETDKAAVRLLTPPFNTETLAAFAPKKLKSMEEVEKEQIKEALEVTRGNVTRAAEILGYKSRQTMLNKMDRYGIPREYADPRLPQ
jgi:DNA-binding NtrC family response regulator